MDRFDVAAAAAERIREALEQDAQPDVDDIIEVVEILIGEKK